MKTAPTLDWIRSQCTMIEHPLGPCWAWPKVSTNGYGYLYISGKINYAHRVTMALSGRAVKKGMHTDHLCRNTTCCNPDHLEEVTPKENNIRALWAHSGLKRTDFCKRGHAFETSAYIDPRGFKRCDICRRDRSATAEVRAAAKISNAKSVARNRDKILAKAKVKYAENPELFRARCRASHEKFKEERRAKCRAYYAANKEKCAARKARNRARKKAERAAAMASENPHQ